MPAATSEISLDSETIKLTVGSLSLEHDIVLLMRPSGVYVGDTCVLKTNPQRVGHVTQTQADIDSHADSPLLLEQDISHAQIAPPIFNQYLSRGIPPTGTAMVSWLPSTSADAGKIMDV